MAPKAKPRPSSVAQSASNPPEASRLIRTRLARAADFARLQELFCSVDELHAALLPSFFCRPAPIARPVSGLVKTLAAETEVLLVAESERRLVGLVQAEIWQTPLGPSFQPGRRCHISELVVAPPWRRRGVGRKLLDAVARWARLRSARQLILTVWRGNDQALRFYEALGFDAISSVMKLDLE